MITRRALRPLAGLGLLSLLALALLCWRVGAAGPQLFPLADPGLNTSQFYPAEKSSDGVAFRWSKPSAGLLLPSLGWRQVYTVTMLFPAETAVRDATVQLEAADRAQTYSPQAGWNSYSIAARSQWGASTALALAPAIGDYSFYPGSGDRRRLGAAVREVALEVTPQFAGIVLPAPLLLIAALLWPPLAWIAALRLRPPWKIAGWVLAGAAYLLTVLLAPAASLPGVLLALGAVLSLAALVGLLWPSGWLALRISGLQVSNRAHNWLAVGLYTLLGLLNTWPLLTRLGAALPGWPADNFAFLYKVWWVRTALQTGVSPFFDPNVYYPFGFFFGRGEPTLPNTLPAALLAIPFGDAAGYNLVLLATFPLSGLGVYLLARELTGNRAAALLAGAIFAIAPYRMAQLAGHLQIAATQWIPLTFYFLERALRRRTIKTGALAGLFFALTVLTAWYYAVITALALLVYLPLRLLGMVRRENPNPSPFPAGEGALASQTAAANVQADNPSPVGKGLGVRAFLPYIRPLLAFAVVGAVLAAPALVLALQAQADTPLQHTVKAADENSASPQDYIIPNELHPLWGQEPMAAHAEQNIIEDFLYVGVAPLLLLVLALAWRRRGKGALAWMAVGLLGFVLSLGITLHSPNGPVLLDGNPIGLPAGLLYQYVPGFSGIRAYARFGVLVILALAVLAGFGAAWWRARLKLGAGPLLFAGLLIVVLVDLWTAPLAWGISEVRQPAVAQWLAEQPGDFAVFQAPLDSAIAGPPLFAGTFYRKRLAYGYETFEPAQFTANKDLLREFPAQEAISLLKSWNVRYVVVDANAYGADWGGFVAYLDGLPALRRVYSAIDPPSYRAPLWVADARPELETYFAPAEQVIYQLP